MEPEENLNFENELMKIKLELEYGMNFRNPEGSNETPPEVMNAFLKHVEAFERSYKDAKQITVAESLGHPIWKKESEISDADISAELDKVEDLLAEHAIVVDVIYTVDDRTLYRFITEELMAHEIDGMNIPGMTCHYIYEEFHPNHEMDIRRRCTDFFSRYLDKSKLEYYDMELTEQLKKDDTLRNFRDAFDSFKNKRFKIKKLTIDGESAVVEYQGSFTAYVGGEGLKFKGPGRLELEGSYDWWLVSKVEWPARV